MPPTLHCIRHGQGFHNVGSGNYDLPDPYLTPEGEQQCETVRILSFPDQSDISLVTASPMTRTLHSAYIIFKDTLTSPSFKCQPEIFAIPDAQETSDDPCDIGSEPSILRDTATKNNWPVDLSLVKDGWNVKALETRYSPHSDAIRARARDSRILLREKIRQLVKQGDTNVHVALVTHGGFLHFFTEDWEDSWQFPATGWKNCETRAYTFEVDLMTDEDEDARIVETEESRKRRQKFQPMFGRDKQPKLFDEAMVKWESQGLQRPDKVGIDPKLEVKANGTALDTANVESML